MKKVLIGLLVLIAGAVAVMLFYKPAEDSQSANVEPSKVISTAPELPDATEDSEQEVAEAEAGTETPESAETLDPSTEAMLKDWRENPNHAEIAKLSAALGGVPIDKITQSPIPGWYEVANNSAIGYVSSDGRYLFDGDLIDLKNRTNLTDARRNSVRKEIISAVDESKMIIFEPKKAKHTVTVFTDVDCGYCRKLHSQIDEYMDAGIRIRYIFYPLRGKDAKSYKTAENVWCSKDRNEAMTQAKQGKTVTADKCDNPVAMHLQTGIDIGIRGTPGLITETGQLLPGYMPPEQLLAELEKAGQG